LTDQRGLTLASAVVLGLAMLGAAVAAARLLKLREASQTAFDSAGRVLTYLASAPQAASGQSLGMAGLREGVELEGVSLCDGRGRQLLRDLHTQFGKGEFVCVLGSDPVALQALLELLLGFGKPDVGEVLIDGTRVSDIAPQALARNILWIDETGPIWSGSVEDNLLEGLDQSAAGNLYDALRRCGVLEQLQAFSDGLATLVSPDDDRLDADMRYGVAVARAILRRPAIIVVREPVGSQAAVQEACNSQLRVLADQGALVIVWPQRLSTLRQADRVIVLRDGQMLAEGSHGELLESSELYRHLNYALFNPYGNLASRNQSRTAAEQTASP
jgi:ABC-type multidrug transport system fused ATPase/permease subunit